MMKFLIYQKVISEIEVLPFDFALCLEGLDSKFPAVQSSVLRGVIAQYYQAHIKRSYGQGGNKLFRPDSRRNLWKEYTNRVAKGQPMGVIRAIAMENRFSASLMAKLLLEEYLAAEANGTRPSKNVIKEHHREPGFIPNGRLSCEVSHANDSDENYGPVAEYAKHSVGQDYEARLRNHMIDLCLDFLDENEQRERGFDKTPDIKLEVPIAVDGHIVNWIESKAMFGDDVNHPKYLGDQLWSYWNRFGPGMVIYWFGVIEELKHSTQHSGILVADSFPDASRIVHFDPTQVKLRRATSEEEAPDEEEALQKLMETFHLDKEELADVESEEEGDDDYDEELRELIGEDEEGEDVKFTSSDDSS